MPLAADLQNTRRARMTRRPPVSECRDETTCLRPNVLTGHKVCRDPTWQKARHSKWNYSEQINRRQPTRNVRRTDVTKSHYCRTTKSGPTGTPETTKITPLARDKQHVWRRTVYPCVLPICKVVWLRQTQWLLMNRQKTNTYHFMTLWSNKPKHATSGHPAAPGNSNSTPLRALTHARPRLHARVNTHEIRALLNFLRGPHFESGFSILCRQRNRPRFNTPPGLRDTSANRRSGKSHTAFGVRNVDIGLRTIFLPVTFFTTQSTLGSRHEALFQRISLTFHGTLATNSCLYFLAVATFSTLASVALALVGGVFAVSPLATKWFISVSHSQRCWRPSGAGIAITGQKPRPRLTWFKVSRASLHTR